MNDLKNYVEYAQPVIKAIRENHNEFFRLQYHTVSPEDLVIEEGLLELAKTKTKYLFEHYSGNIPLVYAQWGEETGASIVLYLTPEERKNLSPEVTKVLAGEYHRESSQLLEEWENTANTPVFVLMDHEYYSDVAGFVPSDSWGGVRNNVGETIDFLSHSLGIPYLSIENSYCGLEFHLDMMSQYPNQVDPADEDHIYFNADPGEKPA